jgi:hypothetical protein
MTKELLYTTKTKETTAAMPRVVHAHSLLHCTLSKAARACVAAVRAALAVSPEQRDLVRQERRPLVLWPSALGMPQKLRRSISWLKARKRLLPKQHQRRSAPMRTAPLGS